MHIYVKSFAFVYDNMIKDLTTQVQQISSRKMECNTVLLAFERCVVEIRYRKVLVIEVENIH